ncbi:hypothetical protein [uncultured Microscilla sp.]|uniref:hypothetical protein n=1 Tax=uncultured Microscilla sp. TaxID=432653 RepID=UPI00261CF4F1|nr:hypothetical protein [uncultured Microscilla sp.]
MKKFFFLIILSFFALESGQSQDLPTNPPQPPPPCAKTLEEMAVSYRGTSLQQIAYKLFAIKYKKDWVLVVLDEKQNFYTFKKSPDGNELIRNSKLFDDNICKLISSNTLDIKIKPKTIAQLDLACYYKFNRAGRRFYNSLIALDDPSAGKGFWDAVAGVLVLPVKGLAFIFVKPFQKLFASKKGAALKQVDTIKKQKDSIDKKMKALDSKKKKLDDLLKKMKKLEEEQAKKLEQKK